MPTNDRLLRALHRQPVDRTPVWMMRQAGRYLPEYRATRAKAGDFLTLCKTPDLACEVTLQPLARYPLDAAILFSDILTVPDAMGLGLHFVEGEGPQFHRPVRTEQDIAALGIPDPELDLGYVMDAVRVIRRELNDRVPLIGFSGSPWTLATYMVEGGATREFALIKGMLYNNPSLLHKLLNTITQAVSAYIHAQVAAGAQAIMIFDTWGGVLSPAAYQEFSLGPMQQLVTRFKAVAAHAHVPIILFTKNGGPWLEGIANTGCDAVGLDWTSDIRDARRRVGDKVALQGNLDPCVLYASPDAIRTQVAAVLEGFGHGSGHVFNLGHGIHPQVNPEHAGAMIQAVHDLSPAYHAV